MLRLRPHHLLCLQKYTGHGYNEEFVERMDTVIDIIKSDPDVPVELVCGEDMLCEACPNNIDSVCSSEDKVVSIDEKVMNKSELSYGMTDTWNNLSNCAAGVIRDTEQFEDTCGACQWYNICITTKRGKIDE